MKSSAYFIHNGSKIEADWIFELAGHYYKDKRKDQASERFSKEKEIDRPDMVPERKEEERSLVQIGGKKSKP